MQYAYIYSYKLHPFPCLSWILVAEVLNKSVQKIYQAIEMPFIVT